MKTDNYLRQAADDIVAILQKPCSNVNLTLEAGHPTSNSLETISDILQQKGTLPVRQTNDTLAPTVKENPKPTLPRVQKRKSPHHVNFNKARNVIYPSPTPPPQPQTTIITKQKGFYLQSINQTILAIFDKYD